MSYVSLPEPMYAFDPWVMSNSLIGDFGLNNNSAHVLGILGKFPMAGNISKIHLLLGAAAGSPNTKIGFVDVTGSVPGTTFSHYRTINSWTASSVNVTPLITSDGTDSGSLNAVLKGEPFAVRVEWASFDSGDTFFLTGWGYAFHHYYTLRWSGSAWLYQGRNPFIVFEYDDGSLHSPAGTQFASSESQYLFRSSDSPNRYGIIFRVPFNCKTDSCTVMHRMAGTDSHTVKLYASNGSTVLATRVLGDQADDLITSSATVSAPKRYFWDTEVALQTGTDYIIFVEATNASFNTQLKYYNLPSSSYRTAWTQFPKYHAINGNLTETDTIIPPIAVCISAIESAVVGSEYQRVLNRGLN